MTRILTVSEAVSLAAIIEAAIQGQRVARAMEGGEVVWGTARHLVQDERGGFIHGDVDVRDAMLRVTTSTGFEAFWPVSELIPLHQTHEFVTNYKP